MLLYLSQGVLYNVPSHAICVRKRFSFNGDIIYFLIGALEAGMIFIAGGACGHILLLRLSVNKALPRRCRIRSQEAIQWPRVMYLTRPTTGY